MAIWPPRNIRPASTCWKPIPSPIIRMTTGGMTPAANIARDSSRSKQSWRRNADSAGSRKRPQQRSNARAATPAGAVGQRPSRSGLIGGASRREITVNCGANARHGTGRVPYCQYNRFSRSDNRLGTAGAAGDWST